MALGSIKALGSIDPGSVYGGPGSAGKIQKSFADQLQQAVLEVDSLQTNREQMVEGMVNGQVTEVHDVMIAAQESQLAFELLLEVRNKLLESYQEIMRMPV
ncbi:MAG: flagellar hook-basal body complex protein FliE [Gemmatimonadales bacterium]|nr:flagellar hook-basal body complex protein FliE [Gemmatimonadales bacterium]